VWREVSKIRNSSAVNLIIFDEIGDSSIDEEGFAAFNKILNELVEQNVIIISHNLAMAEMFERSIVFTKKADGFNEMCLQ